MTEEREPRSESLKRKGPRVLIKEREAHLGLLLRGMLEQTASEIEIVETEEDLLRRVGDEYMPRPDIILVDTNERSALISGLELVHGIRDYYTARNEVAPDMVLMSGNLGTNFLTEVNKSGVPLLGKPFDQVQVVSTVQLAHIRSEVRKAPPMQ